MNARPLSLVATVILAAMPATAAAQKLAVERHTLSNGMTVLTHEDHSIPMISFYVFYRVGSKNERPGITGVSHLFEHMMFNGSGKFKPKEFDLLLETAGSGGNGYTNEDFTAYQETFPRDAIDTVLDLESDRMRSLLITPQNLEQERGIVKEERRSSTDNVPAARMYEELMSAAYVAHPYGWPVVGWMVFCLQMMRIALELAQENRAYEGLASKFFQHYIYIGAAMKKRGGEDYNLWDERDGFFYDVLRHADGRVEKLRVRSLVGLVPLYAVERLEDGWTERFSEFRSNMQWFVEKRHDLAQHVVNRLDGAEGGMFALTIVDRSHIEDLLHYLAEPSEFLSDFGLRSLSKCHATRPFVLNGAQVLYEPGEADSKIKGGNSNWRGPVWFPTAFLMIEALRKLARAYGDSLGTTDRSGRAWSVGDIARTHAERLIAIFLRGADGRRPVYGDIAKFQNDPHWRDYLLFHEYFHAETGAGLGASHQTGWTGLVASLIDEWCVREETHPTGERR